MKIEQQLFAPGSGRTWRTGSLQGLSPSLVLAFGSQGTLGQPELIAQIKAEYPSSGVVFAAGGGEITSSGATAGQIATTAIAWEATRVRCLTLEVPQPDASRAAGAALAARIADPTLTHVLVLFDAQAVDGAELARGLGESLPRRVTLTSGAAGSGNPFERALVGLDELPAPGRVVAAAFHGTQLQVGFGSAGGWTQPAEPRTITGSRGHVLFELDGKPALDVYRSYLNPAQKEFTVACRQVPLSPSRWNPDLPAAPTVVAVDSRQRSLLFDGEVHQGAQVQFMQVGFEDLLISAAQVAKAARLEPDAELALCMAGAGRQLLLGDRLAEEARWIRRFLGRRTCLAGLYSHSGSHTGGDCRLNDQTIAITTLRER